MRPGFEFVLYDNNTWNEPVIILHSNSDLPDAYLMNDLIELSFSNKNYENNKIKVRKMVTKRESTRKVPCVQYEHELCRSIEDKQLILEKFHCRIPMLYSGKHLDTVRPHCTL